MNNPNATNTQRKPGKPASGRPVSGRPVLGRGLEALMSQVNTQNASAVTQPEGSGERLEEISLNSIFPNRLQPRRTFNEDSLVELAESLKQEGILQPLLVTRERDGYMLVAGERRLRAARLAGLEKAPVKILPPMDDRRLLQIALIENLQREDLNPIETALGYRELMERFEMTQNDLSEQIGKSRSAVANSLRLLNLPGVIRDYVALGKLTEGHARALLSVTDESEQVKLATQAMSDGFTVRRMEEATKHTRKRRLIPKHRDVDLLAAENTLKQKLQAPVKIKPGLKRGKIEIEYKGVADLNRLLELLQSAH